MSVPKAPPTPWTDTAPTGSSIRSTLSMKSTESTTRTPAMRPIMRALAGLTLAQPAVMATSPTRRPFIVIPTSGLPLLIHDVAIAAIAPPAAAMFVVIAIVAMLGTDADAVLPGLNPNHPNHSTSAPIVASVML